jgi:hypothetical protein
MNTTQIKIQSHSVLILDYHAMNMYWTDTCVHSHVVSLCLHFQSPSTTEWASHTPYIETTSTHILTRTQIWCVLECDAVYSCKDQQDFEGTCPLYNQDSLLYWGVEAAGSSKILVLATKLHFKEHRFIVRFKPVAIQIFELGSVICSSCFVLCVHICTHTQCNQDM